MGKSTVCKGVRIRIPDRTGVLGEILSPLAEAKVNIEAFHGYAAGNEANLFLVPDEPDYSKMLTTLRKNNVSYDEMSLVGVELDNKPGQAAWATSTLSNAGINIEECFSSTYTNARTRAFFSTDQNEKAVKILG